MFEILKEKKIIVTMEMECCLNMTDVRFHGHACPEGSIFLLLRYLTLQSKGCHVQ